MTPDEFMVMVGLYGYECRLQGKYEQSGELGMEQQLIETANRILDDLMVVYRELYDQPKLPTW